MVLVERILARVTTHTVAVGQQVLDDLVAAKIVRPQSSSVVAPGVEDPGPCPREDARKVLGLPVDAAVITFVGRLTRIKRGERFIALARELESDLPDAVFVVVGDGPERGMLEREAAGLRNVVFAGWQSNMAQVYSASDLLVLTSDNEGMPVALIEGAMQGVPAVATDVGAVRQVVADGETGLVVTEPDDLVEAVRKLLSDEALRQQMGTSAARRARVLFSQRRLVSDYAELYERLLLSSPKAQRRRRP